MSINGNLIPIFKYSLREGLFAYLFTTTVIWSGGLSTPVNRTAFLLGPKPLVVLQIADRSKGKGSTKGSVSSSREGEGVS